MFEVKRSVDPVKEQPLVTVHRPALLHFSIFSTAEDRAPQETQFAATSPVDITMHDTPTSMGYRLGYEVCVDEKVWSFQEQGQGFIEVPGPQLTSHLHFQVVPKVSGPLPLPKLLLSWVPLNAAGPLNSGGTAGVPLNSGGTAGVPLDSGGTAEEGTSGSGDIAHERIMLTDAQVYDLSHGQTVVVHTSSSVGR